MWLSRYFSAFRVMYFRIKFILIKTCSPDCSGCIRGSISQHDCIQKIAKIMECGSFFFILQSNQETQRLICNRRYRWLSKAHLMELLETGSFSTHCISTYKFSSENCREQAWFTMLMVSVWKHEVFGAANEQNHILYYLNLKYPVSSHFIVATHFNP